VLAVKGGKIHAVTITDNPGGKPALPADALGAELCRLGIEPLVHFTCKDKNRNQLESNLYCPMSQCPKNQRNGACGGSRKGFCEVYPDERLCIYVKAYAGLKRYGEEGTLEGGRVPPCNWDFRQTSSWINYYLGRDHTARKLGVPEIIKK